MDRSRLVYLLLAVYVSASYVGAVVLTGNSFGGFLVFGGLVALAISAYLFHLARSVRGNEK